MEGDQTCAIVAMDSSSFCYRVCAMCEKTLSEDNTCKFCNFKGLMPAGSSGGSKCLYRILLSIAVETKVFVVVCFDRAAKTLFGCSADELFDFAKINPFAVATAGKILEGELFRLTLSAPKNGNAEHLRVVSIVPLSSDFRPIIESLKKVYSVG
ncbi:hypothetical protein ACHQM5_020522 [Ranunculus cassubicifolius]